MGTIAHGTATELTTARFGAFGGTIGNYALFAGGRSSNSAFVATVETYNASLTKGTATNLQNGRAYGASANTGSYVLFAGGDSAPATVEAYNTSLTRSSATVMGDTDGRYIAGLTFNSRACFGGGGDDSSHSAKLATYNSSLTLTNYNIGQSRYGAGATVVGNYALFAGGLRSATTTATRCQSISTSWTSAQATALSAGRGELFGGTIGSYAVFGSGRTRSSGTAGSAAVDTYNTSLTHGTTTDWPVSVSAAGCSSTQTPNLGDLLVIAGGLTNASRLAGVANAYTLNSSLTRTATTNLAQARGALAGAKIASMILYAGGTTGTGGTSYGTVDWYQTVSPPVITVNTHPQSATYDYTDTISALTVSATITNNPTSTTYQWQSSTNGSTWTSISGATSSSYTPPKTVGSIYYRVIITATNSAGSDTETSNSATITVLPPAPTVTITTQPQSATYYKDDTPTALSVVISSTYATTTSYQWQTSSDGTTWTDISRAVSATYTPSTATVGITYYRVVVTVANVSGTASATSSSATIEVLAKDIQSDIQAGTLTLSGQTIQVTRSIVCSVSPATLTLSGQTISNTNEATCSVQAGALTLTGQPIETSNGMSSVIDAGALTLTGQPIETSNGMSSVIDAGALTLTGQPIETKTGTSAVFSPAHLILTPEALQTTNIFSHAIQAGELILTGEEIEQGVVLVTGVQPAELTLTGEEIETASLATIEIENGELTLDGHAVSYIMRQGVPIRGVYRIALKKKWADW